MIGVNHLAPIRGLTILYMLTIYSPRLKRGLYQYFPFPNSTLYTSLMDNLCCLSLGKSIDIALVLQDFFFEDS